MEPDWRAKTRQSWNQATRNHNAHKGDQAARLRAGEGTLFEEEVGLLGDVRGKRLAHLQCNAGQDSLSLAMLGAQVVGVDLSDEAIDFAQRLSAASEIGAAFERAEVVEWLEARAVPHGDGEGLGFDVAFSSYGAVGWLPDLGRWARGVCGALRPGGVFVLVEFHPLVWSFGADLRPTKDDYFAQEPFIEPVGDYVAASGEGLGAGEGVEGLPNEVLAWSWQYGVGQVVEALAEAGLVIERLREYPHSNGCRVHPALVWGGGRRWVWPSGVARLPLMYGLRARKPL